MILLLLIIPHIRAATDQVTYSLTILASPEPSIDYEHQTLAIQAGYIAYKKLIASSHANTPQQTTLSPICPYSNPSPRFQDHNRSPQASRTSSQNYHIRHLLQPLYHRQCQPALDFFKEYSNCRLNGIQLPILPTNIRLRHLQASLHQPHQSHRLHQSHPSAHPASLPHFNHQRCMIYLLRTTEQQRRRKSRITTPHHQL